MDETQQPLHRSPFEAIRMPEELPTPKESIQELEHKEHKRMKQGRQAERQKE